MSADLSTPQAVPRPVARRGPVARAARQMLRSHAEIALWFWAAMLALIVIAIVLLSAFGQSGPSVVQFARQAVIWFPFSMMITAVAAGTTVHVAAGGTRRAFARASVVAALVYAAVHGAVLTLLLQAERLLYDALGWDQSLTESGLGFAESTTQVGPLLLGLVLTVSVATASGLLVGIAYFRGGGWIGTLTLPLTAGPILLVTGILSGEAGPFDLSAIGALLPGDVLEPAGLAMRVAYSLVVIAAELLVFERLTQRAVV